MNWSTPREWREGDIVYGSDLNPGTPRAIPKATDYADNGETVHVITTIEDTLDT